MGLREDVKRKKKKVNVVRAREQIAMATLNILGAKGRRRVTEHQSLASW